MEYIRVTKDNIEKEHICCAISNNKDVPVLEQTAKENGIAFKAIHIENKVEAQNAPTPITNYALFHDGKYVTNEQMNEKKFLKLAGK